MLNVSSYKFFPSLYIFNESDLHKFYPSVSSVASQDFQECKKKYYNKKHIFLTLSEILCFENVK